MMGRIVGPTVGGSLFKLGGFRIPFFVVGAMVLVFGFLCILLLLIAGRLLPMLDDLIDPKRATTSRNSKPAKASNWFSYFANSIHGWLCCVALILTSLVLSFPEPTLSLYLGQLGMTDPAQVGIVFLIASLCYAVASVVIGKLSDVFPKALYWVGLIVSISLFHNSQSHFTISHSFIHSFILSFFLSFLRR